MKRDQLDYVQFDVGFFSKPKHKALRFKFGGLSLLCLVSVLCDMGAATNAEIDDDVFFANCGEYGLDNGEELLAYLLQNKIIFRALSGKLSNSRVVEDQESLAEKREDWRNRQNKKRDKGRESRVTLNTEDLNTEDLNINNKKDSADSALPPEKPPTPTVAAALHRWKTYQKTKYGREFDEIQAQSVRASFASYGDELARFIDVSIGAGWKTINAKRDELPDKTAGPPKQKLSPSEKSQQAARQVLEMVRNAGQKAIL